MGTLFGRLATDRCDHGRFRSRFLAQAVCVKGTRRFGSRAMSDQRYPLALESGRCPRRAALLLAEEHPLTQETCFPATIPLADRIPRISVSVDTSGLCRYKKPLQIPECYAIRVHLNGC